MNVLYDIQQNLKAPKDKNNDFGKYKYRTCERILEAVKQILPDGVYLTLSDEMVEVGGRVYVKATATLVTPPESESMISNTYEVHGWAREAVTKKGMDDAQITGAASSYARKYALSGLFAIDDTKDSDVTNETVKDSKPKPTPKPKEIPLTELFKQQVDAINSLDTLRTEWAKKRPKAEKDYILAQSDKVKALGAIESESTNG